MTLLFSSPLTFNDPFDISLQALFAFNKDNDSFSSKASAVMEMTLVEVRKLFTDDGVFCGSIRSDNQLLWSHYAEKHTGVVFEFEPAFEKDSVLTLATPVSYVAERPILYRTPEEFIEKTFIKTQPEVLRNFVSSLIMSKYIDWQYEEEVRVCVHKYLTNGEQNKTHRFHANELKGVYLGCRMEDANKDKIRRLVKQKYPNAHMYQMFTDTIEYKLLSKPI